MTKWRLFQGIFCKRLFETLKPNLERFQSYLSQIYLLYLSMNTSEEDYADISTSRYKIRNFLRLLADLKAFFGKL